MNYEFKGTQGEWRLGSAEDSNIHISSNGWLGFTKVYYNYTRGEEHIHNAHLISAAPELLQACIAIENTLRTMTNNPVSALLMTQLQQAIHKALNIQQ